MIQTGFNEKVKIYEIIENHLPEFVLDENEKFPKFLEKYYISQEFQSGPVDISENLDQYLKLDQLIPQIESESIILNSDISEDDTIISVNSVKGFPKKYGLLKIDDEIITYSRIVNNSFVDCTRGFSGITGYHNELNQEELIFTKTNKSSHSSQSKVENLSILFLKEFFKKLKYQLIPGLEEYEFDSKLKISNFIKEVRSFFKFKGTDESFRILFNILYGVNPTVINLEKFLLKPSSGKYVKREVCIAQSIGSDNVLKLKGQTIQRTNDPETSASISEIDIFYKNKIPFYKIELFRGYEQESAIKGNIEITPSTKCLEDVSSGDSVINVDSTIGFPNSGVLLSGNNVINYTDKSINQFFGCTGITIPITNGDTIHSNDTYFGFDPDTGKKITIRLHGVISDFDQKTDSISILKDDILKVKGLGKSIRTEYDNKLFSEIFEKSWVYNTRTRYEVDTKNNKFVSKISPSTLKVGDRVELLDLNSNQPVNNIDGIILEIKEDNQILIKEQSTNNLSPNTKYSIRRKLNKPKINSIITDKLSLDNENLISDIQNLYFDDNLNYSYVASNSLPSSNSNLTDENDNFIKNTFCLDISKSPSTFYIDDNNGALSDVDVNDSSLFSSITFPENVNFVTGDEVQYISEGSPLRNLKSGEYYFVSVDVSDRKKIKLYKSSNSLTSSDNSIKVSNSPGRHTFTLRSQKSLSIKPQKLFKKFPISKNLNNIIEETKPGKTGMLINGVEIANYKSDNSYVYYGPLEKVETLFGGEGYDVITEPKIEISEPENGTRALVQPVISGSIQKVFVDSNDISIDKVISIKAIGGNGKNASFEPVLVKKPKNIFFNAASIENGGGIGTNTNQITFNTDHKLSNGQEIVYESDSNTLIYDEGVIVLENKKSYFAKVDNDTTVTLFNTLSDFNADTNAVGYGTTGGIGIHRFRLPEFINTLTEVKIINPGEGYTNRKLIVSPSNVSVERNLISFENHGFSNGDIIECSSSNTIINGLNTTNQYFVLKINDDEFRLCDAGIGGTITSNFDKKNYVLFSSSGTGYQTFKYPDIQIQVNYTTLGSQEVKSISATPDVKGSIKDLYLYDGGTGYGSTIINYHQRPVVTIKNGIGGELTPILEEGKIIKVRIQSSGEDYFSIPNLIVTDPSGKGSGAVLRAVVTNGKITDVKIEYSGIGYGKNTFIKVVESGYGAKFRSDVRQLTVNEASPFRFGSEIIKEFEEDNLQYTISGYFEDLRNSFGESDLDETPLVESSIIGWAYDGNPIYGPFGYSNPNVKGNVKKLESGYSVSLSNILNRPTGFNLGFFVEDYVYSDHGDLDQHNGRFTKTKDFPNGIYAYFATIDNGGNPQFPYFIGNTYRSSTLSDNLNLNQYSNINDLNIYRNIAPYEEKIPNEFITGTDSINNQKVKIDSIANSSVNSINIVSVGNSYKVGDKFTFKELDNGSGLDVKVSSLVGKTISSITSQIEEYNNSVFESKGNKILVNIFPNHNFNDGDYINISGITTYNLEGSYKISFEEQSATTLSKISQNTSIGSTEIILSSIPSNVSVGSSIQIGDEILEILNIYREQDTITAQRSLTNTSHSRLSVVKFLPDSFEIDKELDYFESHKNDIAYFNPKNSIGLGTVVGIGSTNLLQFGENQIIRNVPVGGIYIENHPFKTNQKLILSTPSNISAEQLIISTNGEDTENFPSISVGYATVYVVNKTPNVIGLKTELTSSEILFHEGSGEDKSNYKLETTFNQVNGTVNRVKTTVNLTSPHELNDKDLISLSVQPNLNVGIGTSTNIRLIRNSNGTLGINKISVTASGYIWTTTLPHGLSTGDRIFYTCDGSGYEISSGSIKERSLFVTKIDDTNFSLSETYSEASSYPPLNISITGGSGSDHTVSLINPQIKVIKGNNLKFDLSDSSLQNYNLNIYSDENFKNNFVSTGLTSGFNVLSTGINGSSSAELTILYDKEIPKKLYYNLEKSGYISTSDFETKNYNEIVYLDSEYTKNHVIYSAGINTFTFFSREVPERSYYISTECSILEYSTTSNSANGGVDNIDILSGGSGYENAPIFVGSSSTNGSGVVLEAELENGKNINGIKQLSEKYTYSSDKTLSPESLIPTLLLMGDDNTIDKISIVSGGSGYTSPPKIVIANSITGEKIDTGLIVAKTLGSSVTNIDIEQEPKGLPYENVKLFTVNNSNGIAIERVDSDNTGIFTCFYSVPRNGFITAPFAKGDFVFVEGIQKQSDSGSGFNSEDYGFKLFKISENPNTSGSALNSITFDLGDTGQGLTTNTGRAVFISNGIGNLVNEKIYPKFEVTQRVSFFDKGEYLNANGIERDLIVARQDGHNLYVTGSYLPLEGENLVGKISGTKCKIISKSEYKGRYEISATQTKELGWIDDVGKLDYDNQVFPDNDYYQNLSYTIKSPIYFKDFITPVNSLVHTAGLKNFGDTGITSSPKFIGIGSENYTTIVRDFISENRVDSINDFEMAIDINSFEDTTRDVKFRIRKLTNYIDNLTNKTLIIDNINSQFSNVENEPETFKNLYELSSFDFYDNLLVRITDTNNTEIQLTELIVIGSGNNNFIFEKGTIVGVDSSITLENDYIGEFSIDDDPTTNIKYLRFTPLEANENDYNIKYLKNSFETNVAGIGSQDIGFVRIFDSSVIGVATGITTSLLEESSNDFKSFYINAHIVEDGGSRDANFAEVYVTTDENNTYMSEYYFDTSERIDSNKFIGTFSADLNSSVGIVTLSYTHNSNYPVNINAKIVGIGSTDRGEGIGTYRFKYSDIQEDGSERSAIYSSNYSQSPTGTGATTVISLDKNLFNSIKSLSQVSIGDTQALHQVYVVTDGTKVYTEQIPFISNGSSVNEFEEVIGLGTFGGEISGTELIIKFYPDDESGISSVSSFNMAFYSENDTFVENKPRDLVYGNTRESLTIEEYNALNGDRINRKDFLLTNDNYPIFARTFDPAENTGINTVKLSSGEFFFTNHFFSHNEKLKYTPKSVRVGLNTSPITHSSGTDLDSTVYVHNPTNDPNKFQLKLSDTDVVGLVFDDPSGSGNAHTLEMDKNIEKTIISLDNIIQHPIAGTGVTHSLSNGISTSQTIFELSGISTIFSGDLIKIDDEFVGVLAVGFGTTSVGPITGIGTTSLVQVERGFVGSSATAHDMDTEVSIYKGSFNIVDSRIYFVDAPRGNNIIDRTPNNLLPSRSEFDGRVFLRKDYSTNKVYDDISSGFNGIGRTFTLTSDGNNGVGIGTTGGNGLLFLNGIFQKPKGEYNSDSNFEIIEDTSAGISSVVFSGIRSSDPPYPFVVDESDINENQVPRGGIIVSLGSTPGLGYAPLVGASITAVIDPNSNNSIDSVTGDGSGVDDDYGSGYNNIGIISVTVYDPGDGNTTGSGAVIVAEPGIGGTLRFTVEDQGQNYSPNTQIFVTTPSYENLSPLGSFRVGIGTTTDTGIGLLVNVDVGPVSNVGIGSTHFGVTNFDIIRQGYNFRKGDEFTLVGLVTDYRLESPIEEFKLSVLDTFTDSVSFLQFGQLYYIDSIKSMQNGIRNRFPLFYNQSLLSFEKDVDSSIVMANLLVIFVNGVLQKPNESYFFEGGTSFVFAIPPLEDDDITIFYYGGTIDSDTNKVENIFPSIESGDIIELLKNNLVVGTETQEKRTIWDLSRSDQVKTDLYDGNGIDEVNFKPLKLIRQKNDKVVNGQYIPQSRESLLSQTYPISRIISDIPTTGIKTVYVDSVDLFDESSPNSISAIIVDEYSGPEELAVDINGKLEIVSNINTFTGATGILTGIDSDQSNNELIFYVNYDDRNSILGSLEGSDAIRPIYIFDTQIEQDGGGGIISLKQDGTTLTTGAIFCDNVYDVKEVNVNDGYVICKVDSNTDFTGLTTVGSGQTPSGRISWGRLENNSGDLLRKTNNSITITERELTITGLTTFPSIQRRSSGLRDTGSLSKQ